MRAPPAAFLIAICGVNSACGGGGPSTHVGAERGLNEVGLNLAAVNYYATQAPFADTFRNRDLWQSTDGKTWDTEQIDKIPADADGYPLELPSQGQTARASAFLPVRAGSFELTWQGDGDISVMGPELQISARAAHSLKFTLGKSLTDPLFVSIQRSSAQDHVRAISIQASEPYDAKFKASMAGFRVLRFMDWAATNGNPVSHWSERTTQTQPQGAPSGVSIETMIDTANQFHADFWYNVPHQADDDFIERAAKLIASKLASDLKVYVEYSNENWNGIFPQVPWEQDRGNEAGLNQIGAYAGDDDSASFWAGLKFSMRRAARAHTTFRAQLGRERVVAVVAGQSTYAELNDKLLTFYEDERINPLGGRPDALAVAPYFGKTYQQSEDDASTLSVDKLLSDAAASLHDIAGDVAQNREIADAHGVHLVAYEAGQHILAVGGLENDKSLVDRMIAANRHPRMAELYHQAQQVWVDNGGELAVYYNSCQAPGKYGAWGLLEYQDQALADAPKWAAIREIAAASN